MIAYNYKRFSLRSLSTMDLKFCPAKSVSLVKRTTKRGKEKRSCYGHCLSRKEMTMWRRVKYQIITTGWQKFSSLYENLQKFLVLSISLFFWLPFHKVSNQMYLYISNNLFEVWWSISHHTISISRESLKYCSCMKLP